MAAEGCGIGNGVVALRIRCLPHERRYLRVVVCQAGIDDQLRFGLVASSDQSS